MLRNIKILAALLFLNTVAFAQTVSPPACNISGGTITCPGGSLTPTGGPGGENAQIQFNDNGLFGGSSLFTFDKTTGQVINTSTILTSSFPFTINQTWNNAGVVFSGVRIAITDTASNAASLPFQVLGGSSGTSNLFNVSKTGLTTIGADLIINGALVYNGLGRITPTADGILTLYNNAQTGFTRLNFGCNTSSCPAWANSNTTLIASLADGSGRGSIAAQTMQIGASGASAFLLGDGADILAQRNGTNAQISRIYNTYIAANDFERGFIGWASNVYKIGTEAAGSGLPRAMTFVQNGTDRWSINTGGHFIAAADNTYDIGASGANRPRTIYAGTGIISSGFVSGGSSIVAFNATPIPAGGATGTGFRFSSTTNFGMFFGSGAPTLSAAKGSLYLRSDGTGSNDRAYINTDGGTTWTAIVTVL